MQEFNKIKQYNKKVHMLSRYKGPFILHSNSVELQHCTLLHGNCNVTALPCRMKVKFILTWKCGVSAGINKIKQYNKKVPNVVTL